MDTLNFISQKFDLNLTNPQPIQIPQIGRNGLAELFTELGFKKGAEIGVDRGVFSEELCRKNPNLHLIAIDSWATSSFEDPKNRSEKMALQLEDHFKDATNRLSPFNCKIIREKSLVAAKTIADKSLDFVYIDANHNFVHIAEDLYNWRKKVRQGGIVAGHDYHSFPKERDNHVKHVVDAFTKAFEITPYFELAIDRYHSWFFVN